MALWSDLLSEKRFSTIFQRPKIEGQPLSPNFANKQFRLPVERDHDRILFSTPLRRLGDKTQVFPLESIESIRSRLTHSYEVSNLARSVGIELATLLPDEFGSEALRKLPSMLAAVGLAHDIGNPPFGHQGENAIRSWFKRNQTILFDGDSEKDHNKKVDINRLTQQHKNDFINFEGNAQTLRVLTKLQVIGDDLGLNLTVGTLSALMKYIAASDKLDKNTQSRKKVGFFASEQKLVESIRKVVGLKNNARHPLALVMEACDDIAYSVLDAEDSIKKGLVSFNDLLAWMKSHENNDEIIKYVVDISLWDHKALFKQNVQSSELNDVSTQKFRVHAIHVMVTAIVEAFIENYKEIISGKFDGELLNSSKAANFCKELKTFDRENAFNHRTVLEIELNGYNTINNLMNYLWTGITQREEFADPSSKRTSPFAAYVYSRISRNYRRVFEGKIKTYHPDNSLPLRYREMQLLTDMISGMTDRFCIELYEDLTKHHVGMRPFNEEIT